MIITSKLIREINELNYKGYEHFKIARQLDCDIDIVKHYVKTNYLPDDKLVIKDIDLTTYKRHIEGYILSKNDLQNPNLLTVSEEEKEDIESLKQELNY